MFFEDEQAPVDNNNYPMRKPCANCGGTVGYIVEKGKQDVLRCHGCDKYQYCVPRTESGKRVRTIATTHKAIRPKLRARVLTRATGRCELCGARPSAGEELHVGHLLSVEAGMAEGLTELILNSEENLAALCGACNLGLSNESLPLRLCIAILKQRTKECLNED
jgi:ribosomal protein S14